MPDIFTSVWVEISQSFKDRISFFIDADVYLNRLCKRTGTRMVDMHNNSTAINGRWGQILLLHRLLMKKQWKKLNKSKTSKRLLKGCKRQKLLTEQMKDHCEAIKDGNTSAKLDAKDSNGLIYEISAKHEIVASRTLQETDTLQEEQEKDEPEFTTADFQLHRAETIAEDTESSDREPVGKLESKYERDESKDSIDSDDEKELKVNEMQTNEEELHPKKSLKVFKCTKCDFTSNHRNSLRDHGLRVHSAIPEKCQLCEKVFPSCQHLKRHMICHQNLQCICDVCGKVYKTARTLEKHRKTHCSNFQLPNFECLQCKNSFSSKAVLENHIETQHAGKKASFLCATCGKVFTRKYSLQQHQLLHTGSRLTCDVCHKSFSCESSLRDHKNIHSDLKSYQCPVCFKSFNQRTSLQKHSKIHAGNKSFKCAECGRGFTQKQALQRHERSHKGLKPFTCKICHKSYGDAAIIRKHLILVHKINKDPLKWKEDIIQNELDSSFVASYEPLDQRHLERNETQIPTYNSYEGSDMISTENINEMQLPMATDHNAKALPAALPEDLSMSTPEVHHIQSQMHQIPLTMYQHSQTLYSDHVDPSGVDHGVYPTQHDLSSVAATYPYIPSSQTQPDQNLDNNHVSSNPYLATSQPQTVENMEDNTATPLPYLSNQPHPQSHVEEDHNSSSHQYSDAMLEMTNTQRPEGQTAKHAPADNDSTENLSLSTLYAYYSSLASQYLNMTGYNGYSQPTEDQQQSQQNV